MKKFIFLLFLSSILFNEVVAQDAPNKATAQDSSKQKKVDMPKFPGEIPGLISYLSQNLRYPAEALKDSISGRVILKFTVGKDGSITEVKVFKSLFPACDDEAVRVVKAMPKWEPGSLDGKKIPVIYTLPITFSAK